MPKRSIELHDSEVVAISTLGEQVIVFLSGAYVHASEGRPMWDDGSAYWQAAALVFPAGSIEAGDDVELAGTICDGSLEVGGQVLDNEVPVPFAYAGEVVLRLWLHTGTPVEVVVKGEGLESVLIGEAVYEGEPPGSDATRPAV